jgi:hypothetical protein
MLSSLVRCAAVLILVLGGSAHAQLSFNLPKVTGLNAHYDPAIFWLPGGAPVDRNVAYGFGVEASFAVSPPKSLPAYKPPNQCRILDGGVLTPAGDPAPDDIPSNHYLGVTSEGEECRICYVEPGKPFGKDAWGEQCNVNHNDFHIPGNRYGLEVAVGYGQTGTYGSAPFFGLDVNGQSVRATGIMRTAPSLTLYLTRKNGLGLYVAPSVGLITLSAQTFLPPVTDDDGVVTTPNLAISGTTLAPSLRAGYTFEKNIYAEIGYEFRHFNAVDYKVTGASQIPPSVPLALTFHSVFLRVGTWWRLQD